MNYSIVAIPGIVLFSILVACEIYPSMYGFINPIYMWVTISTVGIPCILAALLLSSLKWFTNSQVTWRWPVFALVLVLLTIPSVVIFVNAWLAFHPNDGPALGYMGLFYIGTAQVWIPALVLWGWRIGKLNAKA